MGSSPGSPSWKWLRPENAQIEFVCAGAAVASGSPTGIPVGGPGPLISPPNAAGAATTAMTAPDTAVARNDDFMRILHLLNRFALLWHVRTYATTRCGASRTGRSGSRVERRLGRAMQPVPPAAAAASRHAQ